MIQKGILGLIWTLLWFILTNDSPSNHKFISNREKSYILEGTGISAGGKKKVKKNNKAYLKIDILNIVIFKRTPWIEIITSKAFISLVITHTCSNFGTYLFLTQLPTYMSEVLNFDIKSVSLI